MNYSHLHVHTQYSLLDGASAIPKLFDKAIADNMPAIAITDHGNMFGVFQFVAEAQKRKNDDGSLKVKPIVGCEFYVVENRHRRSFTREEKDVRYHQVLLAKNETGYRNLMKLCSLGFIEGNYGKYPRIDKELIEKYHEGLIATTCCLAAEVPRGILRKKESEAEEIFKWWLNIFGEDYYIELQRHNIADQVKVNAVLLEWAKKYKVKTIATNDAHYVEQEDANAHDILLCINTGEKQATPKAKDFSDDDSVGRGTRFAFANDQFYFKTKKEMELLFADVPESLDNTNEIVDKIEILDLHKEILLPHFQIPKGYDNQDAYLTHITYDGAKKRYKEITPEVEERLQYELFTIKTMGFAGYFLIVADFINHGKDIGVFVGPGRGSAAGSAVAYCIGITNIDPIKYDLLFERFLNPDRKSLPDIDTDFDDEGRQRVIDYVVDKYGKMQVAQLITYGTMAAKSSIKDVARVLDLPLSEANILAKCVPDRPGTNLNRIILAPLTGENSLAAKENLSSDDLAQVKILRKIYEGNDLQATVLKEALKLEGSVRNTGIHAAGIIIAPKDLTDLIPIATSKESNLYVTQYEGNYIESAGVIKMDFLGLKTLSILKTALNLIKENHAVEIDLDNLPLDDTATFELYQRAETNGTFQFESTGMQKYLKELKPDKFNDLIAMNALYRPGPMEYIPSYILRKHGKEKITYDLPDMQEFLEPTYGITVYQEQVMQLSQKLAGFTKVQADKLRSAMGKKKRKELDEMKSIFMDGCKLKNYPIKVCEKIWTDWESFAQYAFNKSHSTCYAMVAYQTAYLKTHYPAEYMSAVLTHNMSAIDKVSFFMDECRRMDIPVLGPDVNESYLHFSVNKRGQIRFGLAAIKGVGGAAVNALIDERKTNGNFDSLFDLVRRVNLRTVNKKTLESLVLAGAMDMFGINRSVYLENVSGESNNMIESAIKYGNSFQNGGQSDQPTLFGEMASIEVAEPNIPEIPEWNLIDKLKKELEVCGIYLSGHPLDDQRIEIEALRTCAIKEIPKFIDQNVSIIGLVSSSTTRMSKKGEKFIIFNIEDFSETIECALFREQYARFKHLVEEPGYIICVKATVKPSFRDQEKIDLRVNDILLLSQVREKQKMKAMLSVPLEKVNKDFIHNVDLLIKEHPGKDSMVLNVSDGQCELHFRSTNTSVQINKHSVKAMEKLGELSVSLI
ncbi:MAG: DNA polymerase III subunit alpha [Bacteroidetes bacterium]|nr:DNA polymerase III subunit alpha [Bacteroidota bacterium]